MYNGGVSGTDASENTERSKCMDNDKANICLMTIPQIAKTGLLPESTLRAMERAKQLPSIKVRKRTYVNYGLLLEMLANLNTGGGRDG